MSLLTLLTALLLDHYTPWSSQRLNWLLRPLESIAHFFNAGKPQQGQLAWFASMLPALVVTGLIFFVLQTLTPFLAWVWDVVVLYVCFGLQRNIQIGHDIQYALSGHANQLSSQSAQQRYADWLNQAELPTVQQLPSLTIGRLLLNSQSHFFGVVVYFVLFSTAGPVGAVLYRFSHIIAERWHFDTQGDFAEFAHTAVNYLEWLPTRCLALTFAVAGDFDDALYCWRNQTTHDNPSILLASGAGSLGVLLELPMNPNSIQQLGIGDTASSQDIGSAISLTLRATTMWILLLLLVNLARLT